MNRPRICLAVIENDPGLINKLKPQVDLFEVRMDLIGREWRDVSDLIDKPWIACNRSPLEGGKGQSDEQERISRLIEALNAGAAIVDIELSSKDLQNTVLQIKKKARCLISYHNLQETPSYETLKNILDSQVRAGADICKIVTAARSLADNTTILKLIHEARNINLVAFAMGEKGRISRILSPLAGGYFTYASADAGKESAAGQIPVAELTDIYRYLDK